MLQFSWQTENQIEFKLVSSQERCPGAILILLWASLCQASELHQETKKSSSPGVQSVEIDVFSEDGASLLEQNSRKVIFPGCPQKEYVAHPYTFSETATMEKYQD